MLVRVTDASHWLGWPFQQLFQWQWHHWLQRQLCFLSSWPLLKCTVNQIWISLAFDQLQMNFKHFESYFTGFIFSFTKTQIFNDSVSEWSSGRFIIFHVILIWINLKINCIRWIPIGNSWSTLDRHLGFGKSLRWIVFICFGVGLGGVTSIQVRQHSRHVWVCW